MKTPPIYPRCSLFPYDDLNIELPTRKLQGRNVDARFSYLTYYPDEARQLFTNVAENYSKNLVDLKCPPLPSLHSRDHTDSYAEEIVREIEKKQLMLIEILLPTRALYHMHESLVYYGVESEIFLLPENWENLNIHTQFIESFFDIKGRFLKHRIMSLSDIRPKTCKEIAEELMEDMVSRKYN